MKETLIKLALRLILGVTAEQWRDTLDWVSDASIKAVSGAVKNEWVRNNVLSRWPQLKPHVLDALVGFAVGWFKKADK